MQLFGGPGVSHHNDQLANLFPNLTLQLSLLEWAGLAGDQPQNYRPGSRAKQCAHFELPIMRLEAGALCLIDDAAKPFRGRALAAR